MEVHYQNLSALPTTTTFNHVNYRYSYDSKHTDNKNLTLISAYILPSIYLYLTYIVDYRLRFAYVILCVCCAQ